MNTYTTITISGKILTNKQGKIVRLVGKLTSDLVIATLNKHLPDTWRTIPSTTLSFTSNYPLERYGKLLASIPQSPRPLAMRSNPSCRICATATATSKEV